MSGVTVWSSRAWRDAATLRRIAAMEGTVRGWCERLAASPLPPSLDQNDLHDRNVLLGMDGGVRYYDWGDSVVAHPFAAMLVPLGLVRRGSGEGRFLRALDAEWATAPLETLALVLDEDDLGR